MPRPVSQPQPSAVARIGQIARWRRAARHHLPKAHLEPGSGPWVSISECGHQLVRFHPDEPSAQRAVVWLDQTRCGGRGCRAAGPTGLASHWTLPLE